MTLYFMVYYGLIYLPGKYYYEVQITDEGLCRVGFSTDTAVFDVGKGLFIQLPYPRSSLSCTKIEF